jgi:hypothetical protein
VRRERIVVERKVEMKTKDRAARPLEDVGVGCDSALTLDGGWQGVSWEERLELGSSPVSSFVSAA